HANWAHLPATSAWIASRLTGIPFSFSAHAGRDLFRTSALLRVKLRDASFAIACNDAARARLIEAVGREAAHKVHVCYHGVDLERFQLRSETDGAYLLSVGNLDAAKGFDVAVRSLTALRGRDVPYRIVGAGKERDALAALAARLGLGAVVDLAGVLHGAQLVEAYRGARVFLAPSRILPDGGRDGLPNVVLEAMAVGVPVVASNVAALPEAIVHERTGLLVASEDEAALSAAIVRLLDDRELRERLVRAARERVVRTFDRARNVEHFCSFFESLPGLRAASGSAIDPKQEAG
ncbi:MAG: glycosyltransferase family 4 protein, partial [Candidatus Binatia bacterium]